MRMRMFILELELVHSKIEDEFKNLNFKKENDQIMCCITYLSLSFTIQEMNFKACIYLITGFMDAKHGLEIKLYQVF